MTEQEKQALLDRADALIAAVPGDLIGEIGLEVRMEAIDRANALLATITGVDGL